MDEQVSYFELKYLIHDNFYYEVFINGYSFGQAAGICYEAFSGYICSDGIESIFARIEILKLQRRHKLKLDEQDIQSMNFILEKSNNTDWPKLLNAQELEYFEEDLEAIKEWVNCIDEHHK